jgi:tRNA (guanine-N7-)-methyltransferase
MARSQPAIDVSTHLIEPPRIHGGPEPPIVWSELFPDDRPLELEIGSGKGLFLLNSAAANPGHNFLGIELSRKYARLSAETLCRRGITNAKVWSGDARAVLARHVPGASVRAVHVYFPDPWWKKRHKKRRVFTESLVNAIERVLEIGGLLSVASDVEEYFTVIQGLIAAHPRFLELPAPTAGDPTEPGDYLTNFERKYRIEGRVIHRARYRLSEPANESVQPPASGPTSAS